VPPNSGIMGGDGGVVAVKKQYMHGGGVSDPDSRKNDKLSTKDTQSLRTHACPLSGEALVEPIVACELGHLYSKESILQCLLDKSFPSDFCHIRTLKDVKEVHFTEGASTLSERDKCKRICPLTGLEFNGIIPFLMLWSNGKVISEKGYREMGIDALQEEFGPFDSEDVVKLVPLDSETERQRERMLTRRERRQSTKKKKKMKDNDGKDADAQPRKRTRPSVTTASAALGVSSVVREVIHDTSVRQKKEGVFGSLFHKASAREKDKNDVFINLA
jgi:hypothetical protein